MIYKINKHILTHPTQPPTTAHAIHILTHPLLSSPHNHPPHPQVMEEKISADYVEVASVTKEGYKSYSKEALEAILGRV